MSGWAAFAQVVGNMIGDQVSAYTNYQYTRSLRRNAYVDTVKDLKRAGLNPILAVSNGANGGPGVNVPVTGLGSSAVDAYNKTSLTKEQARESWTKQNLNQETLQLIQTQNNKEAASARQIEAQTALTQQMASTEFQKTLSEKMANSAKKAILDAVVNEGRIKSDNPNLQLLDILTQAIGNVFGAGNSAKQLFSK